jgi:hypothetical protein
VDDLLGSFRWYDAVCINQKDDKERSQQTKLMPELYSIASLVIIWLGKNDTTSDEAIGLIEASSEASFMNLIEKQANQTSLNKHGSTGLVFEALTARKWQSIANLLLRTWFHRVWTLQEILLPVKTISLCGSRRFHIDSAIILAAELLRTNDYLFVYYCQACTDLSSN